MGILDRWDAIVVIIDIMTTRISMTAVGVDTAKYPYRLLISCERYYFLQESVNLPTPFHFQRNRELAWPTLYEPMKKLNISPK
jgi:hypothetical protein